MSDTTTDDNHEPAITPEESGGEDTAARAGADADDSAGDSTDTSGITPGATIGSPGAALADHDPIYRRTYSESTRSAFKALASKLSKSLEDDGMEVAIGGEEAAAASDQPSAAGGASTPAQAAAAPAATPAPSAQPAPAPAATPAPAPAIVPLTGASDRALLDIELREKAIGEREAALAAREAERVAALDAREKELESIARIGSRYLDRGADEIVERVKEWTGAATEDEVAAELTALIGEISAKHLKIDVDPAIAATASQRRAVQKVRAHTAELERKQKELDARFAREREAEQKRREEEAKALEAKRQELEQKQHEERATRAIGAEFAKGVAPDGVPYASKFPHLLAEPDPQVVVMDIVRRKAELEPNWKPSWTEAADIAEKHYRARNEDIYRRVSPIINPAKPQPAAPPAPAAAQQQGAPAQGRGARTLTTGAVAPLPPAPNRQPPPAPAPPPAEEEVYDPRAHRSRSLGRLKADLAKRQATEA